MSPNDPKPDDVRMRGFRRRSDVDEVRRRIDELARPLEAESVPLDSAAGRSLATDVVAPRPVPAFARSERWDGPPLQDPAAS